MPLIVVYLWKESKNLPRGHSAMKIEDHGGSEYFSWWPSHNGRATPPTYGPSAKTTRKPAAKNAERQLRDMTVREVNNKPGEQRMFPVKSDKEMLQSGALPKHATFKFFFRGGLDVDKAKAAWESLLASDAAYNSVSYSCHMPVAEALIKAFSAQVVLTDKGHVADKAAKKLIKAKGGQLIPDTLNGATWSVAKLARLCAFMAASIDAAPLSADSKVIVRHNVFDVASGTLTKHDYAGGQVDFIADSRTSNMVFVPGDSAPGKINPRMSAAHHEAEAAADASHFAASDGSNGSASRTSSTSVPSSSTTTTTTSSAAAATPDR
jgi:hypothetical protein